MYIFTILRSKIMFTSLSKPVKSEALPGFLGKEGNKGIYFRETGEQRPNFEGNRGTKTIFGNRKHKKTHFRFLGNMGTSQFISGEQGNKYPPPPRRASKARNIFDSFMTVNIQAIYILVMHEGNQKHRHLGSVEKNKPPKPLHPPKLLHYNNLLLKICYIICLNIDLYMYRYT